jgi:hypothetical protein
LMKPVLLLEIENAILNLLSHVPYSKLDWKGVKKIICFPDFIVVCFPDIWYVRMVLFA